MTSTSAERSTTAPAPVSERPAYGLLAGLALGLLPAELDQSVFATALPTVVTELGGLAGLALINTSYVLAGAVAMLLVGPLGDRFGRRPVFVWATVAFLAGSVLGGWLAEYASWRWAFWLNVPLGVLALRTAFRSSVRFWSRSPSVCARPLLPDPRCPR